MPVALCVLGGVGAGWLVCSIGAKLTLPRTIFRVGMPALILGIQGTISGLIQPYGVAYFNALVGGPAGATGRFDLNDWGDAVQHEVDWVNTHAPIGARVNFVPASVLVDFQHVRPDLSLVHGSEPRGADAVLAGDYVLIFPYYAWLDDPTTSLSGDSGPSRRQVWRATQRDLEVIHVEQRLGAPMFMVFRNSARQ